MTLSPKVRKAIYTAVAVANAAIAAGLLAPFGPDVTEYAAKVILFANAVVGGGAVLLARKNVNA